MRITFVLLLLFSLLEMGSAQQRNVAYYVQKAQDNSPINFKNQNERKIAGLDLEIINALLTKPEVAMDARILLAPIVSHDGHSAKLRPIAKDASSYYGYDLAATDGGQYQSMITLRQPLFTGTNYQAYKKQADLSGKIADNNIALTNHELEKIVTHQYLLCLKSAKQADISSALLKKLEGQVKIMETLVEHALYKQSDLMLLRIEFQNYQIEYTSYLSDYKDNVSDLNLICGIEDTTSVSLQEVTIPLATNRITRSNYLNSYILDSLNIHAEQSISDLKYKPTVALFADGGLNAVYLPTLNRLGISAGVALSWSLFDGNQQKIQRQKSLLSLQSIEKEKERVSVENQIYKNKTLNQIQALGQKSRSIEQQLNDYTRLMTLYQAQLSQGEVSVVEFKNLYNEMSAKQQEGLTLKMERQALIILYNYLNY